MGNIYDSFNLKKYHRSVGKMKLKSLSNAIESTNNITNIIGNIGLAGVSFDLNKWNNNFIIAGSTFKEIQLRSHFANLQNDLIFNTLPKVGFSAYDSIAGRSIQNSLVGITTLKTNLSNLGWTANQVAGAYAVQSQLNDIAKFRNSLQQSVKIFKNFDFKYSNSLAVELGFFNKPIELDYEYMMEAASTEYDVSEDINPDVLNEIKELIKTAKSVWEFYWFFTTDYICIESFIPYFAITVFYIYNTYDIIEFYNAFQFNYRDLFIVINFIKNYMDSKKND